MEHSTSHETNDSRRPELALAEENVDDLRVRQKDILANPDMTDDEKRAAIDETVRDYLGDHGIQQDDPKYNSQYQALRDLSADTMSNIQWRYGDWNKDTKTLSGKSGYDRLHDLQMQVLGRRLDFSYSDSGTANDPDMDEYEALARQLTEKELTRSREEWATVSAKRQGRAWGKGGEDAQAAEDAYQQSVRVAGIHELSGQISDSDDETTKNAKVYSYLFEEQVRLRELTTNKLQDTKLGKYVEWMNSGGKLKRLGKAALIGAGAAVASGLVVLAAPVALGVGAGVAGGIGTAAAGTARFARGYARGDRSRGMASAESTFGANGQNLDKEYELSSDENSTLFERLDESADAYDDGFERDTRKEQNKRKKAVAIGAVAVVAGTGIGIAAANAGEIGDYAQENWDSFKGWINGEVEGNTPDANVDLSDRDGDGIRNGLDLTPDGVDAPELDRDGDGIRNWMDAEPDDPSVGEADNDIIGSDGGDMYEVNVGDGEGYTQNWVQFAEANGHTLTQMQSLRLHEALVEEFGEDYIDIESVNPDVFAMADGQTGLNASGSAKWEKGVPEFAIKWMTKNGIWK